jgi:hypothetical protein
MERVEIWYLTDNKNGKVIAQSIKDLGINLCLIGGMSFRGCEISANVINLFIIDVLEQPLAEIMSIVREDQRIQGSLKFVVLKKSQIRQALDGSMNMLHVEFVSRPVNKREFILLLEKSMVVERYREIMKYISRQAEDRIETFESLMTINRKDFFESEEEKEAFEKILEYEKHLMEEQNKLNRAIREFTFMRQRDIFDMKDRIKAEEMLTELRRKELMDANSVIKAQESLIDFSSLELHEANKIIDAKERVEELGRLEAIGLHQELLTEKEKNQKLAEELQQLRGEVAHLRAKG